jgi:hypothetical protein
MDPNPEDPTDYALPPQNEEESKRKAALYKDMEAVKFSFTIHGDPILTRDSENKTLLGPSKK